MDSSIAMMACNRYLSASSRLTDSKYKSVQIDDTYQGQTTAMPTSITPYAIGYGEYLSPSRFHVPITGLRVYTGRTMSNYSCDGSSDSASSLSTSLSGSSNSSLSTSLRSFDSSKASSSVASSNGSSKSSLLSDDKLSYNDSLLPSPSGSSSSTSVPSLAQSWEGIVLREVEGRIDQLQAIESILFRGVKHGKEYFKGVIDSGTLSQIGYLNGELAGAISCYIQTKGRNSWLKKEVYISTFGVLEHLRCQGVGSKLMRHLINEATSDPKVERILLNVHQNDEKAIGFYKKFGFQICSYNELAIGGSYIMEKRLRIIT